MSTPHKNTCTFKKNCDRDHTDTQIIGTFLGGNQSTPPWNRVGMVWYPPTGSKEYIGATILFRQYIHPPSFYNDSIMKRLLSFWNKIFVCTTSSSISATVNMTFEMALHFTEYKCTWHATISMLTSKIYRFESSTLLPLVVGYIYHIPFYFWFCSSEFSSDTDQDVHSSEFVSL